MPAIHTADRITTHDPRVQLPPLEYLPAPVREAAEAFLKLHRSRSEAVRAVDLAERAVQAAQAADEAALATALLDGEREPKPRARAEKAEAAVRDAVARRDAYHRAVGTAHERLRDAVVAHREEWAATVAADQADAVARLEQAARDWTRAHRDLINYGSVAAMLRSAPERLTLGTYRPAAPLSRAVEPLAEAVAAVQADQAATAPVPAEAVTEDAELELVV